ncbi:MAG: TIM barrel protein [Treponema sp.]|jgi:hydroxypyruvate isomerase|nr:TIM barrel protein [Treponema sp.]
MNFSVCIDAVFKGTEPPAEAQTGRGSPPDTECIENCKKTGVQAFEFWAWWDRDLDTIKRTAQKANLKIAAMCTKFISLTDPAQREEYKKGLRDSLQAAAALDCGILISQTGDDTGEERRLQHKSIVDGLKECVPILEKTGVTLAIEPLNTLIDHKGYYLWQSSEAFQIIDEVNSPCVKVLYDIYHQQIMEGNIVNTITANIEKICHFHAAGLPGRAELQNGELNYPFVFSQIQKAGYKGYVGLEYFPKLDPLEALGFLTVS